MNSYRAILWILLGEWINDAEIKCVEYDSQLTFVRQNFSNIYYLWYIILTFQNVTSLVELLKI